MRAIVSLLLAGALCATASPVNAEPNAAASVAAQAQFQAQARTQSGDGSGLNRLAGDDRYDTSAKVAEAWPAGVDVAYVVSGLDFPDALAAAARAGKDRAPVLLSDPASLPDQTRRSLSRLRPTTIVVVGGSAAVSGRVVDQLRPLASSGTVRRVAGQDRYRTAATLAGQYGAGVDRVYLASGENFPDALAGAALAGHQRAPLLLSDGRSLDRSTQAELARLRPREVVVLGGTTVVSDRVARLASSAASTNTVSRLAGKGRYGTSRLIADRFSPGGTVYIASGTTFPDALVGAARAARDGRPVVLTDPNGMPEDTDQALTRLRPDAMWLLGGTSVVSGTAASALSTHLPASAAPVLRTPGTTGALPVGEARYSVPSGAVFVSPSGSDSNYGTQKSPLKTVRAAMDKAPTGGTVVLRKGTYHQQFTINKRLTIQNYPGEAVWFDGSLPISTFERTDRGWLHREWTTEFDSSPSYTRGSEGRTDSGWGFVNPDYPMAAHPDQVWVDGTAQRQVERVSQLKAGTFFVDDAQDRLYLGTNPQGATVRASRLDRAIEVRADGVRLRGFGVRRYAPSVPDMGTITMERPSITLQNLHVTDNATTGVSMLAKDQRLDHVTVARNGLLGVHGNHADNADVRDLLTFGNNTERFNKAPVSGGLKITRARGVRISDTTARDNRGPGLWLDESVYNGRISNSVIRDNTHHGVSLEISSTMLFVGNVVQGNTGHGIKINNTSDVQVWNNTFADNGRPINIVQDQRRGDDRSVPGRDPRRPFPDPDQPWINGPVRVSNNIIAGSSGNCLLCVEDYSHEFSAAQMGIRAEGNVYQRDQTADPRWVAVWSRGKGDPSVYTTLTKFREGAGQEQRSLELAGSEAVDAGAAPRSPVTRAVGTVAQPLPAEAAALVEQKAGVRYLGAFMAAAN
ncbi:MAG: cell wall-binding repeat-containing protein [Ornithinimicrobium sp.]